MYKIIVIVILTFYFPALAFAEQETKYFFETDPGSFVLDGYSLNVFMSPKEYPDYRVGMALFSFEFPDFIVDSNSKNANKNWLLKTQIGTDLYFDRTFIRRKSGEWIIGLIAVFFNNHLSNESSPTERRQFQQLSLGLRSGFIWYPLNGGFYLNPWFAVTRNWKLGGENAINGNQYFIQKYSPFGSVHVGYKF